MFARVLGLGLPAALGGLYMTGSLGNHGGEGQVFDVPAAQVYARLSNMTIPSELRQGTDSYVSVEHEPENVVRWKLTADGYEALRVTATITPLADGKAAAVETELTFAETGPQGADGKILNSMGGVKTIGGILIDEQIAATVEGRPFDHKRAKMKAAAYTMSNRAELQSELALLQGMMKSSTWASATIYEQSQAGQSRVSEPTFEEGEPMSSTRPMVDVSRPSYAD